MILYFINGKIRVIEIRWIVVKAWNLEKDKMTVDIWGYLEWQCLKKLFVNAYIYIKEHFIIYEFYLKF